MRSKPTNKPQATLNRHIPFVDAVFAYISGKAQVDKAVDCLCEVETKHGVMILGSPYSSRVDGFRTLLPEMAPWSLERTLALLQGEDDLTAYFIENWVGEDAWHREVLYPFLSDLGFVLTGGDFANDYCIVSHDCTVSYSWRSWGYTMADWANTCGESLSPFDPPPPYKWTYIDFYSPEYVRDQIESFERWRNAVRLVLDVRTTRVSSNKNL